MVWFRVETRKNLFGNKLAGKPIKKFIDGEPDWNYFGGGMYSNYFSIPQRRNMRAYEIFPPLKEKQASLEHIVTDFPRSFEIYKHIDSKLVRFAIRSTSDDIIFYAKTLNVDFIDTGLSMLPIVSRRSSQSDLSCYFFDFELENQLNFTMADPQQEPIINKIISAMNTNCGIMIQFLFTTAIRWNKIANITAVNLDKYLQKIDAGKTKQIITGFRGNFVPHTSIRTVPDIDGRTSSSYTIGKRIEKYYHQKANSVPISLAIRGMIIGKNDDIISTINDISAVFRKIVFFDDYLRYCDYVVDPDLAYEWLLNNQIASEDSIKILENNQRMWSNAKWGIGRDFVPFLCLTPAEFSLFVSLPTDFTLPISFRRHSIRSASIPNSGFVIGHLR